MALISMSAHSEAGHHQDGDDRRMVTTGESWLHVG